MLKRKEQKQTVSNFLSQKPALQRNTNPFFFSLGVNFKVPSTSYYVREGTFLQKIKSTYLFPVCSAQGDINAFSNLDDLYKSTRPLYSVSRPLKKPFSLFNKGLRKGVFKKRFAFLKKQLFFLNTPYLPVVVKQEKVDKLNGCVALKIPFPLYSHNKGPNSINLSRSKTFLTTTKKQFFSKNGKKPWLSFEALSYRRYLRKGSTPSYLSLDRAGKDATSAKVFTVGKHGFFEGFFGKQSIDKNSNRSNFFPLVEQKGSDLMFLGRKGEEFERNNRKKSRFLKERNAYLIPDFVEIQRKSFFQLLENGLIEEFAKRNPITNKNLEIFFYPEYYQLTPPEYNPRRAILISKSYSSKLFIPAQLTDKKLKRSQLKWVLIGNLPLMTKRGHFVLNGAPRVIVNQILRSPGIYFQGSLKEIFSDQWSEKPEKTYKRFYTDLICLRGTWLRIEIDKNKDIWAQMKKVPKIPLLWFLLAMGLTERIIFKSVFNPTRLLANFNLSIKRKIDYEYVTNASDAWKAISTLISSSNKETGSYNASLALAPSFGPLPLKEKGPKQQVEQPTLILPDSSVSFDSFFDSDLNFESDPASDLGPDSVSDPLIENSSLPLLPLRSKDRKNPNMKGIKSILTVSSQPTNQKTNLKKQEKSLLALLKKQSKVLDKNKQPNLTLKNNERPLFKIGTKNFVQSKESQEQKIGIEKKLVSFLNIVEHSKEGRNWIFKRFMNPRAYDLGTQGRLNFNRKLGLSISSHQTTLTAQDVLFATDYLFKLEKGLKNIDDIDHLKNRRVRTSGELLQIQIGIGLVRLEKIIREKLSKINAQTRALDFLTNRPNIPKVQVFKLESLPFRASSKKKLLLTPNKNRKKKLPGFATQGLPTATHRKQMDLFSTSAFLRTSKKVGTQGLPTVRRRKQVLSTVSYLRIMKEGNSRKQRNLFITDRQPLKKPPVGRRGNESKVQYALSPSKISNKQGTKTLGSKNVYGGIVGEEFKLNNLINTKAFNGALREFFGSSQLSQFMDQLNPLAEITHKRRLSSMGPGGVTRDSATLAIRGIHPTHYGRICPIETPEGKNTGLVNSLTTYSRASAQGFLESPFYKVYKGQVQKNAGMFFLSAEQEENIKVAAADVSTTSGRVGFLPKNKIPAKIAYGDTISKISRHVVEYIGVSPIQMISIATSLIPFVEHDDANRALMGSNMQRQAVPLVRAERPLVGTGLESRTVSDSGHAVIAKESGYVAYVSGKKMVIYTIPINN